MPAAISAPIVNWRSLMRYTPTRIVITLHNCVSHAVPVDADAESARMRTLVRARKVLARSHLAWIAPSAPWALMVSMPVRLSISVALRCAEAR